MADRLDLPLAGYCRHGAVVGLTIDADPQHLADFIAAYPRVATLAPDAPGDLCPTCCGEGEPVG